MLVEEYLHIINKADCDWSDKIVCCDCCKQESICFNARAFMGAAKMGYICESCLQNGHLAALDLISTKGDSEQLALQLREKYPYFTETEIAQLVADKTQQFESSNPPIKQYTYWAWPALDGDYARFEGMASKELFNDLAFDGNGESLFLKSLENAVDQLSWLQLTSQSTDKKKFNNKRCYVFSSLHSDRILSIVEEL